MEIRTVVWVPDEPWESYQRNVVPRGLSYPVGRSVVEASLRAAGVRLLSLDFSVGGHRNGVVYVLQATRFSDSGTTYHLRRGTPSRPRGVLELYAVPSGVRLEAAGALIAGGELDRACAWLAAAERANPTWLDKSHSWTVYLHNGVLRAEETEGR